MVDHYSWNLDKLSRSFVFALPNRYSDRFGVDEINWWDRVCMPKVGVEIDRINCLFGNMIMGISGMRLMCWIRIRSIAHACRMWVLRKWYVRSFAFSGSEMFEARCHCDWQLYQVARRLFRTPCMYLDWIRYWTGGYGVGWYTRVKILSRIELLRSSISFLLFFCNVYLKWLSPGREMRSWLFDCGLGQTRRMLSE